MREWTPNIELELSRRYVWTLLVPEGAPDWGQRVSEDSRDSGYELGTMKKGAKEIVGTY